MKSVLCSDHSSSSSLPFAEPPSENHLCSRRCGAGEDEGGGRGGGGKEGREGGASSSHLSEFRCQSFSSAITSGLVKDPPVPASPSSLSHAPPDSGASIPRYTVATTQGSSLCAGSNNSSGSSFATEEHRHTEDELPVASPGIRCDGWSLWEDDLPQSIMEAKIRQCIFCIGNGVVSVRGYLEESPVIQGITESYAPSNNVPLPSGAHHVALSSSTHSHLHSHASARLGHPSNGLQSSSGGGGGAAFPFPSSSSSSSSFARQMFSGGGGGPSEFPTAGNNNSSNINVSSLPHSERGLHSSSTGLGDVLRHSQGAPFNGSCNNNNTNSNNHRNSTGGHPPPHHYHPNGASMVRLPRGIFVAGFTEQWIHQDVGWLSCSISTKESFLVPTPDPFCMHVIVGGELVSTTTGRILHHTRHLNLMTGELFRVMEWESSQHQRRVRLESSRILSCANKNIGVMRFTVYAQKTYNTDIRIVSFNTVHGDPSSPEVCHIENTTEYTDMSGAGSVVVARTKNSCRRVAVATFEKCMWSTDGEALKAAAARTFTSVSAPPRSGLHAMGTNLQTAQKSNRYPPAPPALHRYHHPLPSHKLYQDPATAAANGTASATPIYSFSSQKPGGKFLSHLPPSVATNPSLHLGQSTTATSSSLASSRCQSQLTSLFPGNSNLTNSSSSSSHPSTDAHAGSGGGGTSAEPEMRRREQKPGDPLETLDPLEAFYSHDAAHHHVPPFREDGGEQGCGDGGTEHIGERRPAKENEMVNKREITARSVRNNNTTSGSRSSSSGGNSDKDEHRVSEHQTQQPVNHRGDGTGSESRSSLSHAHLKSGSLSHNYSTPSDGLGGDPSSSKSAGNSSGHSQGVNNASTSSTTVSSNSNNNSGDNGSGTKPTLFSFLGYCDGISFNPMVPQTRQTEAGVEVVYSCCDHDSVCVDLVKFVGFVSDDDAPADELAEMAEAHVRAAATRGLVALRRSHEQGAREMWRVADIKMAGVDPALRGAYRFNIAQVLMSTTPSPLYGFPTRSNLPSTAAGTLLGSLPSAAAGGSHSWEVEAIIIPFLSHVCPERARNLLEFRCRHLQDARLNAQDMELQRGAWYPYRTITGSDTEVPYVAVIFVNAVIAYAMRKYVMITNDFSILFKDGGAEVVMASALVYLEWGTWDRGAFHLRAVSGPDTMSGSVNNNFFTNCIVQEHLEWAVQIAAVCRAHDIEFWRDLMTRNAMNEDDVEEMERAAKHIVLAFDARHRVQVMDEYFIKRKRWNPRDSGKGGAGASCTSILQRSCSGLLLANHQTSSVPPSPQHHRSFSSSHFRKALRKVSDTSTSVISQEMTIPFEGSIVGPSRHSLLQYKLQRQKQQQQEQEQQQQKGGGVEPNGKPFGGSQKNEPTSVSPQNASPTIEANQASSSFSSFPPERRPATGIVTCASSPPSVYSSSSGSNQSHRPNYPTRMGGGVRRRTGLAHPQISRYQLCSFPDVVLACMLLPEKFTRDEMQANFDYYTRITVAWGSPLQLGIFSVVAAQLHLAELSSRYYRQALSVNLSIPSTISGLHDEGIDGASAAMAWWVVAVGYSGMRVINGILHFFPMLPCDGEGFQFICRHNGFLIQVKVFSPGKVEYLLLPSTRTTRTFASRVPASGIANQEGEEEAPATTRSTDVDGEANTGDVRGNKRNPHKEKNEEKPGLEPSRSSSTQSTFPPSPNPPLPLLIDIPSSGEEERLLIVHAETHRIFLRCGVPETVRLVS